MSENNLAVDNMNLHDHQLSYANQYNPWIMPPQKIIDQNSAPRGPSKWNLVFVACGPILMTIVICLLLSLIPSSEQDSGAFWPKDTPIQFSFGAADGGLNEMQRLKIRYAFEHIEARTCLRFEHSAKFMASKSSGIVIELSGSEMCTSSVGRYRTPQAIGLSVNYCFWRMGVFQHELAHALGFIHTQLRVDATKYLTLNQAAVKNSGVCSSNYIGSRGHSPLMLNSMQKDYPYDYGSVMHYPPVPRHHSCRESNLTAYTATNALYQHTMGQRFELSFIDYALMNDFYCSHRCPSQDQIDCERRGYPNPNNCSLCICPSGFTGDKCETLVHDENCGGEFKLKTKDGKQSFGVPGYPYPQLASFQLQKCNWIFKAETSKQKIYLEFLTPFSLLPLDLGACRDEYVEVKIDSKDYRPAGYRFCDNKPPKSILISSGDEMMVLLRTRTELMSPPNLQFNVWVK